MSNWKKTIRNAHIWPLAESADGFTDFVGSDCPCVCL